MSTLQTVNRLWALCHILRDDGITYHEYVVELSSLLFLKMMQETGQESVLPRGYRWADLVARSGEEQLSFYHTLLSHLGTRGAGATQSVFAGASSAIRSPSSLTRLVSALNALDWYSARSEGLGDLYEGLLQKNATEKRSGAGQYFTPRPLVDCIVDLMQPQPRERVLDPAAGTGGFLVAADRYIKARTHNLQDLPESTRVFQQAQAFVGIELVKETHRLAQMNAMLHGIQCEVLLGDALSPLSAGLALADVILTNPPFGAKKGGALSTREDFAFPTSNKQLAFLQLVYRGLARGGRAAVVLPENVLFEDGVAAEVRRELMNRCSLHTILKLPTGIFYAPGVKTNVLFFSRGKDEDEGTSAVWVYDMRTDMPSFGKRTPLTRAHFQAFEAAYGDDPHGRSKRVDQGDRGRFRRFTREEIHRRGDHLDIAWLKGSPNQPLEADAAPDADVIAAQIEEKLRTAMQAIKELRAELRGGA